VNILRLRATSDAQPRTKKGRPAHKTTRLDSAACTQTESAGAITRSSPAMPPMLSTTTGTLSRTAIQNRRVMSASSGLGPLSAATVSSSSAMPQMGQAPGPSRRICGCIGQV
jgi:hypothetical protein